MSDTNTKTVEVIAGWTAMQGVVVAPERAAGAAAVIAGQLAVEKRATAALPFEAEPAAYTLVLHRGARS